MLTCQYTYPLCELNATASASTGDDKYASFLMPDCLIQPKGNINNPLKHLRSLEMPGEAMQRECYPTSNAMSRQDSSQERGRKIKAEKDVDCERHNASSLLYTLAAAAASRSSTPNASVKQEGQSSPARYCTYV